MNIDLTELADLARQLGVAGDQAADICHRATVDTGAEVQQQAKADAPKDRPELVDLIRRRTWRHTDSTHTDIFAGPDSRGRPVAVYVNYGTARMPPRPFLTDKAEPAAGALERRITEGLDPFRG